MGLRKSLSRKLRKRYFRKEVGNIKEEYVKLLGFISNDDEISKMNIIGENLLQLPTESIAYRTAKDLFASII